MPLLYEFLLKGLTQSFGLFQILWLDSLILNELNTWQKRKLCPTISILHMNMDRQMLIRIEIESQSKR